MVEMLEKHYSQKVILYATQEAYDLYIKDAYPRCDIWIRSVLQNRVYQMRGNGRFGNTQTGEIKWL